MSGVGSNNLMNEPGWRWVVEESPAPGAGELPDPSHFLPGTVLRTPSGKPDLTASGPIRIRNVITDGVQRWRLMEEGEEA